MKKILPINKNRLMQYVLAISLSIMAPLGLAQWLNKANTQASEITVYKSASCGCCKNWASHLEKNGFVVKSHDRTDMPLVKYQLGIAQKLQSCHTAVVGGYVIEGHVPAEDIKRLLAEKPDIHGLSVPGMPLGSPGMEGPRKDPYNVLAIDKQGKTTVFSSY